MTTLVAGFIGLLGVPGLQGWSSAVGREGAVIVDAPTPNPREE
jgi:hypothetical protein